MTKRLLTALAGCFLALGSGAGAGASGNPLDSTVRIVPGSSVNLVARQASIPVTVENLSQAPLEVELVGEAASFRIQVLGSASAVIPASSSAILEIPVRAIANGAAAIRIWLEIDGERVGAPEVVEINVNYDLEAYLLVLFGGAMAMLMLIGGIRTGMRLSRRGIVNDKP